MQKRTGKFKLLDDGTLEGTAQIEYTGHTAAEVKEFNDEDSPAKREDTLKRLIKQNILNTAEVSDISIDNITDPDKSVVCKFKVRVPEYATRTGKRLFVQPNVFERSTKPMFETATRHYDIQFEYPYSELDEVTIELPPGFDLESPGAPAPVQDKDGISSDQVKIFVSSDGHTLTYHRDFSFGKNGMLKFDKTSYPNLKRLFEAFYKADSHTLTLKETAPAARQ
jgi:hypothetical protein